MLRNPVAVEKLAFLGKSRNLGDFRLFSEKPTFSTATPVLDTYLMPPSNKGLASHLPRSYINPSGSEEVR
jgi:hypothetical protein